MIDLTKKALPNTITVNGKAYSIYTDYRVWLKFMIDLDKYGREFDVGYIFKNEMPPRANINELMVFAQPQNVVPRKIEHNDEIIIDFVIDSDLIYSAFMGQYGIDLIDIEYLHWHKFLALLNGITNDTKLAEVMGYRSYKKKTDKSDPYEKMKKIWKIEKQTADNEKEAEEFESFFV